VAVACSDGDASSQADVNPAPVGNGTLAPLPSALPPYLAFYANNGFPLFDDLGIENKIYSGKLNSIDASGDLCAKFKERGLVGHVAYQAFFSTTGTGGAEGVELGLDMPEALNTYFEDFKQLLQVIGECGVPVVYALEADPMSMAMNRARSNWDFDPTKFPARIHDSGHPDALASGAPDSFAGFCQVLEYLRDTYAPNVMLAPTIKVWASSGAARPDNEPADGWASDPGPKKDADFWLQTGVHWDLLTTNWAPQERSSYDVYRSWARFFAAVASEMGVRIFIWKTDIAEEHFLDAPADWTNNLPQYYFDDAQYLADLGYVMVGLAYGGQMKDEVPAPIACWLKEYDSGQSGNCDPHSGTLGKVMLPK